MAAPDWNQIFKDRPDLIPPGYIETVEVMRTKPKRERRGRSSKAKKKNQYPSLKHGAT